MGIGRWVAMVLAGIRVDGIGWELNRRSQPMIGLLLKRKREISGLSLAQVAKRMGMSSRNAYARYEHGTAMPTIEKLNQLFYAVSPDTDLVIDEARND